MAKLVAQRYVVWKIQPAPRHGCTRVIYGDHAYMDFPPIEHAWAIGDVLVMITARPATVPRVLVSINGSPNLRFESTAEGWVFTRGELG